MRTTRSVFNYNKIRKWTHPYDVLRGNRHVEDSSWHKSDSAAAINCTRSYLPAFLRETLNLPPNIYDKIIQACFKTWLCICGTLSYTWKCTVRVDYYYSAIHSNGEVTATVFANSRTGHITVIYVASTFSGLSFKIKNDYMIYDDIFNCNWVNTRWQ